jgi:hypothetical protein
LRRTPGSAPVDGAKVLTGSEASEKKPAGAVMPARAG